MTHDQALTEAYNTTPPADGKWSWYSELGSQVGRTAGSVYYWHQRKGLPPRYVLPSACRWCGTQMSEDWAARVASRLCLDCSREAGREGVSG